MAFQRLPGKYGAVSSNSLSLCFSQFTLTYEGQDKPIITFCNPQDAQGNLIVSHNISSVNGTASASGYMDASLNPHGPGPNINVGATGTLQLILSTVLNLFYAMPVLVQRWKVDQIADDSAKFEATWLVQGVITLPNY